MKRHGWILFCFANTLWINSPEAISATQLINVYGPKQGSEQKANLHQSNRYILHLASFKSKQEADRYVKQVTQQTTQTVHLQHNAHKRIPYEVSIGPLSDIKELHAVSLQLLPNKPTLKPAAPQVGSSTNTVSQHESLRPLSSQSRINNTRAWTRVTTLSLGFGWNNAGETQTIFISPDVEKAYTALNTGSSIFQGELFAGLQRQLGANLFGQAGIAIAGATRAGLGGDIWEDADPELANYAYSYGITHSRVAIEGKLLADMGLMLTPYVNASVGVGFNKAHNFDISPKLETEVAAPDFQSNTTTSFTYTAGIGVQKALNQHWQMGVGYLFSDWGKSRLAAAPGQTMNSGLALSHLYVNSVLFNLSYLG